MELSGAENFLGQLHYLFTRWEWFAKGGIDEKL
jgi:hypothetical protein